jgi:predicted metal-dependent hydrolase
MGEALTIGGIHVEVVKKAIKNLHLTVHPPQGRVQIVAPERMQLDTIRLYAISKLPWLRRQIAELQAQARESSRAYVNRESHFVWGSRYLLKVIEREAAPTVEVHKRQLMLTIRPGTSEAHRHEILAAWHRAQVRAAVAPLLAKWQRILKVEAKAIFVRQMKTKWGSCKPGKSTIRLNTDLAKKPLACLEYALVHELAHLIEPTHSDRFRAILSRYLPNWPHLRAQLNRAPLAHEDWEY